uniref:Structural maintenance of chromosomes protein 5 n=1 Tax=Panagrellus redivivus TaxID=6233 RepID=A0A7E4VMQ2_PANRE
MDDDEILGFTPEQFSPGSIKKLVFRNFLTFDDLTLQPGPNLNVLIGPNGCGKSTVNCGICLASGGSPKLLGRSDKLSDYVKHGKPGGWVEMYLCDPDEGEEGVIRFKVVIRKTNSVQYYIDGCPVSKTAVQEAIVKYNIQIDNPCVFLAQDKVKSFAEQDAVKLLMNTEKAGSKDLLDLHNQLMEKSESGNSVEVIKKEQEDKLKRIREEINRVRPLAENYKENQQRNMHLRTFREKVLYLNAKNANDAFKRKQKLNKSAQALIDKISAEMRTVEDEMAKTRTEVEKVNLKKLSVKLMNLKEDFARKCDTIGDCFDNASLNSARRQLVTLEKEFTNWEKDVKNAVEVRNVAHQAWKDAEAVKVDETRSKQLKEQLIEITKKFKQEKQSIDFNRRDFMSKKREIERRLESDQASVKSKVKEMAQKTGNRDVINAWEYYSTHPKEFRFPVYMPYTCIVVDKANIIYFNHVFGRKDMSMFVFGCRQDEELLTSKFRISSTIVDYQNLPDYSNSISPKLKKCGFHDYMINMFDAPPPVKAYLNAVYQLSILPIGGAEVDRNCEAIAHNNRELKLFFSNRSRIQIICSFYDPNRRTVKRSDFNKNKILLTEVNTVPTGSQSAKDLHDINAKLKALDQREQQNAGLIRQREVLERDYQHSRKQNMEAINKVESARLHYEKCVRSLGYKQENKPDIEQARAALKEREKLTRMKLPAEFHRIVEMSDDCYQTIKTCVINEAIKRRHQAKFERLRDQLSELTWTRREEENEFHAHKTEEDELRAEFRGALKEFKATVNISHIEEAKLLPSEKTAMKELQKRFKKYNAPATIDECNDAIADEEVRNEVAQLQGSLKDVQRLAQLEQEEVEVVAELEKSQATIDSWEADMTELLERWIHPLRDLVERINVNFSNFFAKINCAGQVVLAEPEEKLKIEEYGIEILVKYRAQNSLQKLTANTQSGGERSVATMLYLMALQELCPVPFRCIDEINQGMDPTNERLVFNMLVDLISGDGHLGKTQYFLLTPKLLPGLNYTEKVAIQIIQNTSFMSGGAPLAVYKEQ